LSKELRIIRKIQKLRNDTYKVKKELDGMLPSNRVLNHKIRVLQILVGITRL